MGFEKPSKATPEEIEKAEGFLQRNPEEVALSKMRVELIKDVKANSDLDPEVFDEISESFVYEETDDGVVFRFRVHGHDVIRASHNGVFDNFVVDGKMRSEDLSQRMWKKYQKALNGLRNISFQKIEKEAKDAEEYALSRDLGL